MQRRHSEALDRAAVLGGGISDVLGEPPAGVERIDAAHVTVARLLGDHRCGGDRGTGGIPLDHRPLLVPESATGKPSVRQMHPSQATFASASCSAARLVTCSPRRVDSGGAARDDQPPWRRHGGCAGYSSARAAGVWRFESFSADSARRSAGAGPRDRTARRPRRAVRRGCPDLPRRRPPHSGRRASGRAETGAGPGAGACAWWP